MIWTRGKLQQFLKQHGVDTNDWGKGMAKTFEHLFNELVKGECDLKVENNKLVRHVRALSIRVYYKDERLIEEYQKMKDGRFRRRILDCSVAEKLTKYDKDLDEAVGRALEEELSIKNITNDQVKKGEELHRLHPSSEDFPGMAMSLDLYRYEVNLKYEQYHPYGYVEHQEDKEIHFNWVKMKKKINENSLIESDTLISKNIINDIKSISMDYLDDTNEDLTLWYAVDLYNSNSGITKTILSGTYDNYTNSYSSEEEINGDKSTIYSGIAFVVRYTITYKILIVDDGQSDTYVPKIEISNQIIDKVRKIYPDHLFELY